MLKVKPRLLSRIFHCKASLSNCRSMETTLKILHDPEQQKFYIPFNTDEAVLEYSPISSEVVDLYHTGVPESLRGKGIAKLLAKEALDHFSSQNIKMKLSCWYLQKYYKENEELYRKHISY